MPRPPRRTQSEIDLLMSLVGKVPPEEIAARTGRTTKSVIDYCHRNRISLASKKHLRPWTSKEEAFLRKNAGKMTQAEMGRHLGRTRKAITEKAIKLGMRSPLTGARNHATVHSDHDVELCRQLFDAGLSRKQIAAKMEIPYQTVVDYLLHRYRNG